MAIRKTLLFSALVLLTATASASAQSGPSPEKITPPKPASDVIIFTNGDQLSGQLERAVGGSIFFKSDMAGELNVPLDKIKELRSSGSFALLRKDVPVTRTNVQTGTILYSDAKFTVANPLGEPQVVDAKQESFIIDQKTYDTELEKKPGFGYGWNGNVTAGASFTRSTQNGQTFNGALTLVRAIPVVPWLPPRNRTLVNVNESYGDLNGPAIPPTVPQTSVEVKTSVFHGGGERDQYFTPHFYALGQTAFDHNYAQGLNLSQSYGGGIGWTPIQTPKQQLDFKADLHYLQQVFASTSATQNQNLIGSTIAEAYRRTLPRKMLFTQSMSIVPAWNDSTDYSATFNTILAVPVYKRLSFSMTAIDNFLNDPAQYYKKNSLQLTTGLTYNLR